MPGRVKERGKAGQAKNFITRTQAVRKLQISLPDFRRLCIFKGIYPREPRNFKKASKGATHSTTFYYTKDIQYLLHEPILAKFREHKAVSKKIARSLGRGEIGDAVRLEKKGMKKASLDHVIKERYPTFVDALRDLDDALSLLFLFANLPATDTVPAKTIALCKRLCIEFQHYIITSRSLRKTFLSIKGIYYQATIQGQDILWLVPYKFVQRVPIDVDFRIMGTFVDFYTTLLGFVNFRLYTTIGLVYPPKFSARSDEKGGELGAYSIEGSTSQAITNGEEEQSTSTVDPTLQTKVDTISQSLTRTDEPNQDPGLTDDPRPDTIDKFAAQGPDADLLPQPQISASEASALFANLTVFISREAPREPLEFILKSFGCKRVAWDTVLGDGAYTHNERDGSITHQIVDRPPVMPSNSENGENESESLTNDVDSLSVPRGHRVPGRVYIQPQWVWDCANQGKLLRPDLYAPGALLPPHLSPWAKPKSGAYDPSVSLAEQERQGEAEEFEEAEAEAAMIEAGSEADQLEDVEDDNEEEDDDEDLLDNGMNVALPDSDSDDEDEENEEEADTFGGFSGDELSEDEVDLARTRHQDELEAEAAGLNVSASDKKMQAGPVNDARKRAEKKRRTEQDELDRRVGMMSNKQKKLFEKMMYGKRKEEAEAEALRTKRRRLEKVGKR